MSAQPDPGVPTRPQPEAADACAGQHKCREFPRALKWLGETCLALLGWKTFGEPPAVAKCIVVAAPHTSYWDGPLMLAVAFSFQLRLSWTAKHTLFRPPLGTLMRWLGAIPIDRRRPHGAVRQLAEAFGRADRMTLAISPEGTRAHTEYWKSGFYHIARLADVPVALGVLDYGKKQAGFGPTIHPTGDFARDMDGIRSFYACSRGLHPEKFGPVRLRDEE